MMKSLTKDPEIKVGGKRMTKLNSFEYIFVYFFYSEQLAKKIYKHLIKNVYLWELMALFNVCQE